MLKSYKDFLLLLEANMKYSEDFRRILSKMKSPIAKDLMEIEGTEVDTKFNYFKPTDSNSKVFYTRDDKFKPGSDENKYRIIDTGDSFTGAWTDMQAKLGMIEPDENGEYPKIEFSCPPNGTIGKIVNSLPHPSAGYDVCYFLSDNGEKCMIGSNGLEKIKTDFPLVQKDDMNVGRIVRQVLSKKDKKYTDKEIEDFVNDWKSTYDEVKYGFGRFELVTGDMIKYWYLVDNYMDVCGTLGGSCMRHEKCQRYLNIYTDNPEQISLLVLKSEDENFSDKCVGRAIVWKGIEMDGTVGVFMDRIYTSKDSDVNLFKNYATKMGWYYKEEQDASENCNIVSPNGEVIKDVLLYIKLDKGDFSRYPYMDTMKSLDPYSGRLKNTRDYDYWLEETDGGNGTCDNCGGEGRVDCPNCDGDGEVECSECDGHGEIRCDNCGGEGEFDCGECEGTGEEECRTCDGSGKEECTTCGGDGKNDEGEECSDCNGSGNQECSDCDGKGNVDCSSCDGDGRTQCDECRGDGENECSYCYGSGKQECYNCEGSGKVDCQECN